MTAASPSPGEGFWRRVLFIVLMLGLTVLFAGLGVWQWQRMGEKEALVAAVADRLNRAPVDFPAPDRWPALDASFYDYRPLVLTGRYLPEDTVFVFTSLATARGEQSGPGYWVMTPFALDGGGAIFVNRGFIPESSRTAFAGGGIVDPGTVTITGVGRLPEAVGAFTPEPDPAKRIEYVRDIERLARLADGTPAPVAPIYIDLPASVSGVLPQGGETVVEFPNNHFGYALTWFGFAVLTPVLLAFWLRRPRARKAA